ncbi:hypothetical protein [Marisediminicola sp. LYQ134]|uniref:hypothetical protein n=1 Tax=unclassified Marisediminicola TaxID=2618316 RepID=UPI003983BACE
MSSASIAAVGIGAQVHVRDASAADVCPWPGEPTGIVVRSAGSALAGVWGRSVGRVWWVEFDEPQTRSDGEGPFLSAPVHEKYLELAPPLLGDAWALS